MSNMKTLVDNMDKSIKIGKDYLFDPVGLIGYYVVRDLNSNVIGFKEAYSMTRNNYNEYTVRFEDVPLGIIRKSLGILKHFKVK